MLLEHSSPLFIVDAGEDEEQEEEDEEEGDEEGIRIMDDVVTASVPTVT